MAITNKEIINAMLKRIKEKTGAKVAVAKKKSLYTLCKAGTEGNPYPQAPEEFTGINTWRTPGEMIEYLAGLEDAIDYYTREKK